MSANTITSPPEIEYFLKGIKPKFHENIRNLEMFFPLVVALYVLEKDLHDNTGNTPLKILKTKYATLKTAKSDYESVQYIPTHTDYANKKKIFEQAKTDVYSAWNDLFENVTSKNFDKELVHQLKGDIPTFITVDRLLAGLKFILDKRNENDRKTKMPGYSDFQKNLNAESFEKQKKAINDLLPKFQSKLSEISNLVAKYTADATSIPDKILTSENIINEYKKELQENNAKITTPGNLSSSTLTTLRETNATIEKYIKTEEENKKKYDIELLDSRTKLQDAEQKEAALKEYITLINSNNQVVNKKLIDIGQIASVLDEPVDHFNSLRELVTANSNALVNPGLQPSFIRMIRDRMTEDVYVKLEYMLNNLGIQNIPFGIDERFLKVYSTKLGLTSDPIPPYDKSEIGENIERLRRDNSLAIIIDPARASRMLAEIAEGKDTAELNQLIIDEYKQEQEKVDLMYKKAAASMVVAYNNLNGEDKKKNEIFMKLVNNMFYAYGLNYRIEPALAKTSGGGEFALDGNLEGDILLDTEMQNSAISTQNPSPTLPGQFVGIIGNLFEKLGLQKPDAEGQAQFQQLYEKLEKLNLEKIDDNQLLILLQMMTTDELIKTNTELLAKASASPTGTTVVASGSDEMSLKNTELILLNLLSKYGSANEVQTSEYTEATLLASLFALLNFYTGNSYSEQEILKLFADILDESAAAGGAGADELTRGKIRDELTNFIKKLIPAPTTSTGTPDMSELNNKYDALNKLITDKIAGIEAARTAADAAVQAAVGDAAEAAIAAATGKLTAVSSRAEAAAKAAEDAAAAAAAATAGINKELLDDLNNAKTAASDAALAASKTVEEALAKLAEKGESIDTKQAENDAKIAAVETLFNSINKNLQEILLPEIVKIATLQEERLNANIAIKIAEALGSSTSDAETIQSIQESIENLQKSIEELKGKEESENKDGYKKILEAISGLKGNTEDQVLIKSLIDLLTKFAPIGSTSADIESIKQELIAEIKTLTNETIEAKLKEFSRQKEEEIQAYITEQLQIQAQAAQASAEELKAQLEGLKTRVDTTDESIKEFVDKAYVTAEISSAIKSATDKFTSSFESNDERLTALEAELATLKAAQATLNSIFEQIKEPENINDKINELIAANAAITNKLLGYDDLQLQIGIINDRLKEPTPSLGESADKPLSEDKIKKLAADVLNAITNSTDESTKQIFTDMINKGVDTYISNKLEKRIQLLEEKIAALESNNDELIQRLQASVDILTNLVQGKDTSTSTSVPVSDTPADLVGGAGNDRREPPWKRRQEPMQQAPQAAQAAQAAQASQSTKLPENMQVNAAQQMPVVPQVPAGPAVQQAPPDKPPKDVKETRAAIDKYKKQVRTIAESLKIISEKYSKYKKIIEAIDNDNKDSKTKLEENIKTDAAKVLDDSSKNEEASFYKKQMQNINVTKSQGNYKYLLEEGKTQIDEIQSKILNHKNEINTIYENINNILNSYPNNRLLVSIQKELKMFIEGDYEKPEAKPGLINRLDNIYNKVKDQYDDIFRQTKASAIAGEKLQESLKSNLARSINNQKNKQNNKRGGASPGEIKAGVPAESQNALGIDENGPQESVPAPALNPKESKTPIDDLDASVIKDIYNDINNVLLVNIINRIDTTIKRQSVSMTGPAATGEPSMFVKLYNQYLDKREKDGNDYSATEDLVSSLESSNLLPKKVLAISNIDKVIFIFVTLFIRLAALSITQVIIERVASIDRMLYAIAIFTGIYILIFLLFVLMINLDEYRLRIVFNYVNFHANRAKVITHVAALIAFSFIIFMIISNINSFPIGDVAKITISQDDRIQLTYRLEVLTMIVWIFLVMIIVVT